MAEQTNVEGACEGLAEFVDDAGAARSEAARGEAAAALGEVVRGIAVQAGVPRFKLDEVVTLVRAASAAEIEERLRQQIRVAMRDYQPNMLRAPDTPPTAADVPERLAGST